MGMPGKEAALLNIGIIKGPSICSLVICILSATLSYGQRQEEQREEGTNKINATLQIVSDCLGPKQGCHERESFLKTQKLKSLLSKTLNQ